MNRLKRLGIGLVVSLGLTGRITAGEVPWTEIPPAQWKGVTAAEVPALKRTAAAAVALPAKEAQAMTAATAAAQRSGLYEIRLTLRPSHVADAVAFHAGLRVKVGDQVAAEFPGQFFARRHQPEIRTLQAVQSGAGPLAIVLDAFANSTIFDKARTATTLKAGGPKLGDGNDLEAAGKDQDFELEFSLTPEGAVYYLVDKIEFRPLSRSGRVTKVEIDKIRYKAGETLKGSAVVADVGGKGGNGTLNLYLEHKVNDRTKATSVPVTLNSKSQTVSFEILLPKEELGYALVAEFVSADGADHSEAAEYFTIADNFQRTALFGGGAGGTRDPDPVSPPSDEQIRKAVSETRDNYSNAAEYFAWASDDLLELTPATDWWFSGQTNYHMNKQTIQRQIQLAHEQGVAMVTYAKWCVSGAPGWDAVYDRPQDFGGAYGQPIGSWDSHDTAIFDLRRNHEQVPYTPRPVINSKEPCFDPWWAGFFGIGPNASPAMIRSAAEEMAASVDMFGWDALRWDGHIRSGWNATGRSGHYEAWAARQTQTLTRYFKDVVAKKHPDLRHGYNYFLIEPNKGYDWAKEDFELDELARGGGLLMNESIGNASGGWSFAQIANNLQVEGDLSRERGGFYLGISFGLSPRDMIIESALWAAAGCRPYNSAMTREVRRYLTRFAEFSLDERLRRLAKPEGVLKPQAETKLWWQPFVYETPTENGRRQLVVNLLNLPLADLRPARDSKALPVWNMPPGTDPVTFALTLPAGLKATAASVIDPQTLAVQPLALKDGSFEVPAVASWSVLVVDLAADAKAPLLSDLFGAPKTFGVKRDTLKDEQRLAPVEINPTQEVWEVNKNMTPLQPEWASKREAEIATFDALTTEQRIAALKDKLAKTTPESVSGDWWKGGVLPDDLKRKDAKVDYGDLTPQRDGRFDIFYGRGAMDYRLRMPEAIAGLERFSIHDAPFSGSFRGAGLGGMGLWDNVPWQRFPEFDLLLFTGIPYAAIGIDNCYALPAYVKAGGAVFFTGGEWAFGKGGYLMTVLDRELLPVRCVEFQDTRTLPLEKPAVMEPGKDFAELGFKADFAAKPSFWVYNQVLLKEDPGVKVFLTSDKGPVLVGWQLGKGRVACLLVDHRGKSGNGTTGFFDWKDWPGLSQAVMRWLAPEAGRTVAEPPRFSTSAEEARKLSSGLEGDALEADLLADPEDQPAKQGGKKADDDRVAVLRRLLLAPAAAIDTAVVAEQLLTTKLPDDVRWAAVDCVVAHPPATLAAHVRAGLAHQDPGVRQAALQCLGAVDPAAVLAEIKKGQGSEADVMVRMPDANGRSYALMLALPLVKTPDLVAEGRRRVAEWNASEKAVLDTWTGGKGFSPAAPELPGLDAISLYERLAWLAYLSRHDAKMFGSQFVREWLMSGVYQDYCWRTKGQAIEKSKGPGDWDRLASRFGRLRDLTRPDVEALVKTAPDAVADGLYRAHFTKEILLARNLLGNQDRIATAGILEKLKTAINPDLAAFAAARQLEKK